MGLNNSTKSWEDIDETPVTPVAPVAETLTETIPDVDESTTPEVAE